MGSWLGYIGDITVIDDHRSGKVVVDLIGRLNKCGCISPRFDIKVDEIEMWTRNLLPCRQFGHIVLTTSEGIMDHEEARRKHVGGKVIGFFYYLLGFVRVSSSRVVWRNGMRFPCRDYYLYHNHLHFLILSSRFLRPSDLILSVSVFYVQ